MTVGVEWYMALAAVLFVIGAAGVLLRKNALVMFMSIELMLNSVNLTFVAAGRELGVIDGHDGDPVRHGGGRRRGDGRARHHRRRVPAPGHGLDRRAVRDEGLTWPT